MNPMGKKLISLFLVFSLLASFGNLFGKERHGAKLLIKTKSGSQLKGELIAVKKNSLLLLSELGVDLSIDIYEAKVIIIVKKSKFLQRAWFGLLIGGGGGILVGEIISPRDHYDLGGLEPALFGMFGAAAGLLIGAISGAISGASKVIIMSYKSDSEIQKILEELSRKARIPYQE